ncbi:MAG: MBL fold metallo-hydrolase [Pseudomonadaceae bacterium]|nr:MBL fold metallo-hydrolase [Pseudomonadaceae bacterium]
MTLMKKLAMLVIAVGIWGCGQDQAADPAATQETPPAVPEAGISTLAAGWTEIAPGGETTCSDGTPYRFFVRPGDTDKLMVFFQGGGACWTRQTCDPAGQPTYTVNIAEGWSPEPFGAFNFENADNPFKDYSVVMAPYCTGDVHIGASDTVYPPLEEGGEPLTVHHQGRANAQAVLDWTYSNVPDPERVFVTGSSAGAIPSPFYAALIANHYRDAKVAQLGDGAGGYRRMNADARPDEQWGTFDFLNKEAGFETLVPEGFNYEKLYIAAARANPEILFARYDAAEDSVQKRFLALGGATDVQLLPALQANHADIAAEVSNIRSFVAGGESHTILRRPEFYSYGAQGVGIRDWVAQLANFSAPDDVTCEDCANDTFAGPAMPPAMAEMWQSWEDPEEQYVKPFKIFDNLYYVGIDWVAAYVIDTGDGLILIDSLYGKWVRQLVNNMRQLGLDPADVKYVINTHGHFDHAGGTRLFQEVYDARAVMSAEDWALAAEAPSLPAFYMPVPEQDIVAADGDVIELGDTRVQMFKTPGHTTGVLSLVYDVRDGDNTYKAITLGGVGLNFSGVERTQMYLDSYARLIDMADDISVSLPNHAAMGGVFERAALLEQRQAGQPHFFVDPAGYKAALATFVANAEAKLVAEQAGTAKDPLDELTAVLDSDD